jgi:H+/Cl- antiporter ClcA
MEAIGRRGGTQIIGWLCMLIGPVVGLAGVLMAWDARLHNAIVSNRVENPWPGYIVAALGVALIGFGVGWIVRARRLR